MSLGIRLFRNTNPSCHDFLVSALLLLFFPPCEAEILFHSDFECGETYLAHELKPGQDRIELVPNSRLEQWRMEGGEGVVEGNLPQVSESFTYKSRKGVVLHGVKGIYKPHPKWANVQTGNLREWGEARTPRRKKGVIQTVKEGRLFGKYSCEFAGTPVSCYLGKHFAPKGNVYHYRFYIRIPRGELSPGPHRQHIAFLTVGKHTFQRVTFASRPRAVSGIFRLEPTDGIEILRKETFDVTAIRPDRAYCVEASVEITDEDQAVMRLFVDGKEKERQHAKYERIAGRSGCTFSLGRAGLPSKLGRFVVDEVAVSTSAIGPVPEKPDLEVRDGRLHPWVGRGRSVCSEFQVLHWQIHGHNAWLLPVFQIRRQNEEGCELPIPYTLEFSDTVNNNVVLAHPIRLPTGIESGKAYYARVRAKNHQDVWSEWSEALRFAAASTASPSFTPNLPWIEKTFLTERKKKKRVESLEIGKWYDLHIFPESADGWETLSYVDVFFCGDPEDCLGGHENRDTEFRPGKEFGLSYSLSDGRIFARQDKHIQSAEDLAGKEGVFVDGRTGNSAQSSAEGWVRIRIRIPEKAHPGLWLLRTNVTDKKNRFSPFYQTLFEVVPRRQAAAKGWRVSNAVIVLALGGAMLLGFLLSRLLTKKDGAHKDEEDKARAQAMKKEGSYPHPVRMAREFIQENHGKPISAKDVAKAVGLSHGHFSRMFTESTGETISQYLIRMRIETAKKLLTQSDLNVSEIASQVGFNSVFHFSAVFRKNEGRSPMAFKKRG